MSNKKELEAEIHRLQSQLSALEAVQVGEEYYLPMGLAQVIQFYTEDEVDKVQFKLLPVLASDGITLHESRGDALMSMPIERFKAAMAEFRKEKSIRENRRQAV